MKTRVFVYGTLLRGEPNHRTLVGSNFVGEAQTHPEFTMVDCGYYPAILDGGSTVIFGEVYEVSKEILKRLDHLEGVPTLYKRRTIVLADRTEAEVYILNSHRLETDSMIRIPSGDWVAYLQDRYSESLACTEDCIRQNPEIPEDQHWELFATDRDCFRQTYGRDPD